MYFKKEGSLFGDPCLYKISYLYTKIPLFLFIIKEEETGDEIVVYNIHCFALLAYKNNAKIKKHK